MSRCKTCKDWLLESEIERHKCPPRLECADLDELEDWGEADDVEGDMWMAVYARRAAQAAEQFARNRLEEAGEIRVRVRNQHGVTIDLRVTAEYELRLDACADGPFSDPTRWERDKIANSSDFHKRTEPIETVAAETATA